MNKVILWGTGYWANKCYDLINDEHNKAYTITAFCENDYRKWGNTFRNIEIISPTSLRNMDFDILVISNRFLEEIKEEILKLDLCNIKKVFSVEEFKGLLFSKKQYNELKQKTQLYQMKKNATKQCIVYTALIGNSYGLKEPTYSSDNIEYICLTNNKNLKSRIWSIRYISENEMSDVMLARKIKILPWEYFSTEKIVCWVDTKFAIQGDLTTYIEKYFGSTGILCFPHYERKCICDETAAIIPYKTEIKDKVILQTATYLNEGFPINNGLYETGCLVRDLSSKRVKELMMSWWEEIERYTYRDQVSLPYVCWKKNFYPDVSNEFINRNEWLVIHG